MNPQDAECAVPEARGRSDCTRALLGRLTGAALVAMVVAGVYLAGEVTPGCQAPDGGTCRRGVFPVRCADGTCPAPLPPREHCPAPLPPREHCPAPLPPCEHCPAPLPPREHCPAPLQPREYCRRWDYDA